MIRGWVGGFRRSRRPPSCGSGTPIRPNASTSSPPGTHDELESEQGTAALDELKQVLRDGPVTLVTATRDLDGSHLAVLAELLS